MSKNLNDLPQEGVIPVETGVGPAGMPSPVSVGTAPSPHRTQFTTVGKKKFYTAMHLLCKMDYYIHQKIRCSAK
ncbi:hypothetical protein BGX23_002479 [Mortierella sp. AD031]|nr:hypothetical protein BGX23_002479 [Mortierella sp. AD031]